MENRYSFAENSGSYYENRREGNRSYLVYECKKGSGKCEEWNMLIGNVVRGLIPCSIRLIDGKELVFYDITSKQQLDKCYDGSEMSFEELVQLLLSLDQLLNAAREYLLQEDGLQLLPEYLYTGMEQRELAILYNPEQQNPFPQSIRRFAEYLLNIVNHEDDRAVVLVYQFYKYAANENFHMGEFLLENRTKLHPEVTEFPQPGTEAADIIQEKEQEYQADYHSVHPGEMPGTGKGGKKKSWIVAAGSYLILAAIIVTRVSYYAWVMLPALAVGYVVFGIWHHWNQKKRKMHDDEEEKIYFESRAYLDDLTTLH